MSIVADIRNSFRGTYAGLMRLIVINLGVFIVLNVIVEIMRISMTPDAEELVAQYFVLPSSLPDLFPHIWTLITYMFTHFGFGHLFFNMLWLFFLGKLFCEQLGPKRIIGTYVFGGVIGGLLFVLVCNLVPAFRYSSLEGASAGVMAVVVTIGTYAPNLRMTIFPFRFEVQLKWIVLVAFLLTSVIYLSENTGGKVAHIGGALFGFIYGWQLKRGRTFFDGITQLLSFKRSKLRVEHRRSISDEQYNLQKMNVKKRIDEILDKISRSGYDSLNREEKDFLRKYHDKL
ncbi:MAG TPA: rhomboid family intramembrane serine protease [Bacteroidia bacterium]|nr:rhomboid family intramembrane serine protease [Bacteroidia bacterium]